MTTYKFHFFYFAPFCGYIKLSVVIMDKKSNKANYFWNSVDNISVLAFCLPPPFAKGD